MRTKELLKVILSALFIIIFMLSISLIDNVKIAVVESIKTTLLTIIPVLFVNSTLASVICKSGIIERTFKKSRINPYALTAYIIGNLGGYPLGVKVVADMLKDAKINTTEAENVIKYSFSPGPAFVLGIVADNVFNSKLLGYICFLSIFVANTLIFIFDKGKYKRAETQNQINISTNEILLCVRKSADAMLTIGATIVFFSAIVEILRHILVCIDKFPAFLTILEISNILKLDFSDVFSFVIVTALLAFGGVCIHMQLISLSQGAFSFRKFYITRIVQIVLSAVISYFGYSIITHFFPKACTATKYVFTQSTSIIPLVCVVLMMIISFTYKEKAH